MKNKLLPIVVMMLITVLVVRVFFVMDFGQRDALPFFAIELNECETEGSENESLDSFDKFFEPTAIHKLDLRFYIQSFTTRTISSDFSSYVREIVSPPPWSIA